MRTSNETVLEVAYDHYKEAYKVLCSHLAVRIRMVFAILVLPLLMLFQSIIPRNSVDLSSRWLKTLGGGDNQLAIDAMPSILSFLLWFVLSSLAM